MIVTLQDPGSETHRRWLLFDEQGRFTHVFQERLVDVSVVVGLGAEIQHIAADELPESNPAGRVDLGVIDLRDRLARHRLALIVGEGAAPGEVRIALCFGLPPVGPQGESVSLGSRQFPPRTVGDEVDWLLPVGSDSIYFLVERPGRGGEWRKGRQQLFGPFTWNGLPAELVLE